eukprot:6455075-Pyramimonas_sp.AAC.1
MEYSQSTSFYWSPAWNILSQRRSIGRPRGIFAAVRGGRGGAAMLCVRAPGAGPLPGGGDPALAAAPPGKPPVPLPVHARLPRRVPAGGAA